MVFGKEGVALGLVRDASAMKCEWSSLATDRMNTNQGRCNTGLLYLESIFRCRDVTQVTKINFQILITQNLMSREKKRKRI